MGLRPENQESRMSAAQVVTEGLHLSGAEGNSNHAGSELNTAFVH